MPDPTLGEKRPYDKNDPNPCSGCSFCCEYLVMEIDTPTTLVDFDHLYWFLIHKDVWIYVNDENEWHVQFNTPCEKLDGMRCGNYEQRPMICREYQPKDCTRYGDETDEKYLFKTAEDLFEYMAKKRPKKFEKLRKKIDLKYEPKSKIKIKKLIK